MGQEFLPFLQKEFQVSDSPGSVTNVVRTPVKSSVLSKLSIRFFWWSSTVSVGIVEF